MSAAEVAGLRRQHYVFVKELADACGVCAVTIRRRVAAGKIPYAKLLGKPYRIPAEVAQRIITEGAA